MVHGLGIPGIIEKPPGSVRQLLFLDDEDLYE